MGLSVDQRKSQARELCIREYGFDPETLRNDSQLRKVAAQVLADMRAQGVLIEWQILLSDALAHNV